MLLDDNVMTDRQAQSSPFSGRFGRKEGIENSILYVGRNAIAVIADSNFYPVAEVLCRRRKGRFVSIVSGLSFSL